MHVILERRPKGRRKHQSSFVHILPMLLLPKVSISFLCIFPSSHWSFPKSPAYHHSPLADLQILNSDLSEVTLYLVINIATTQLPSVEILFWFVTYCRGKEAVLQAICVSSCCCITAIHGIMKELWFSLVNYAAFPPTSFNSLISSFVVGMYCSDYVWKT